MSYIPNPLRYPYDINTESSKYEENIRIIQRLQKSVKINGSRAIVSSKSSSESIREASIDMYFAARSLARFLRMSTFKL